VNRRSLSALIATCAVLTGLTAAVMAGVGIGRAGGGLQIQSRTWAAPAAVKIGDLPGVNSRTWA
jgi:hypothetical protein